MTPDDQDTATRLATTATDLARALVLLNTMKTTRGGNRTSRIMRATPGPQLPGNPRAILLSIELDGFLHEICRDLRDTIAPGHILPTDGRALATWIANNAATITTTIDWANDLTEALNDYAARVRRTIGYDQTAPPPEPRQYASAICQRLHQDGITANPDLLTLWAHRSGGTITTSKKGGKNTYLYSEVHAWATRNHSPKQVQPPHN